MTAQSLLCQEILHTIATLTHNKDFGMIHLIVGNTGSGKTTYSMELKKYPME